VSQTLAAAVAYPAIVYFSTPADPAGSRRRWRDAFTVRRFVPLGLLLVAVGSLPIYQRVMYHRDYFGPRATLQHIVYHNLLIGLGWSPVLRDRYDLGALGDLGAANAIDTFLARTPRAAAGRSRHWAAEGMNTVTTQLAFDWASYEDAGKALYFTIWREQPVECLKVYLYYHPVDIVKVFTGATVKARPGFAYNPFRPHLLLLFIVTAMLSLGGTTVVRPVHGVIPLVMLAAALLVPLIVYAGGFIIVADAFVLVGLLMYTTLWGALAWAGNHVPGAARSVTSQTV
jgi:hypothetical protein